MRNETDEITRQDILLMLLLAENEEGKENKPIIGKTRLQKELFLSQKALKDFPVSRPYSFMPYHYGPYSRDIYNDIAWLGNKGWVEERSSRDSFRGIVREFLLTEEGVEETKRRIAQRSLNKQFQVIRNVKKEYDSMSITDLVEMTHKQYPEYVGPKTQ